MPYPGQHNPFSCMVVDDDDIDRLTVLAFLEKFSWIHVAGSFHSPATALEAASTIRPDIIFLDIDMPGMSGLELREKLSSIPACVFITSYPEYAVDGFEKQALDFLIKPITSARFTRTMERIETWLTLHKKAQLLDHSLGSDSFFIRDGHTEVKVQTHEVIYLEAMKDYTAVMTENRKYLVSQPMGNLLKEKPFSNFIRIHRSYSVPRHFIKAIGADEIELDNSIKLPVGRTFKQSLKEVKF